MRIDLVQLAVFLDVEHQILLVADLRAMLAVVEQPKRFGLETKRRRTSEGLRYCVLEELVVFDWPIVHETLGDLQQHFVSKGGVQYLGAGLEVAVVFMFQKCVDCFFLLAPR
jgi:hypothetical protein